MRVSEPGTVTRGLQRIRNPASLWSSLVRQAIAVALLLGIVTGAAYAVVPATISAVTVTTPPTIYGAGSTVTIAVTFSEAVMINSPTVQIPLNSGGSAVYSSINGSKTIVTFLYVVGATDHVANSGNLDATSTISASLTTGITCVVPADNPGVWSWPAITIGSQGIQLGPQVQSIICANPNPSNIGSGVVDFTVTYSEPVQGVSATAFSTIRSAGVVASVGTPSPAGLSQTFTVPVTVTSVPPTGGTLGLQVLSGPTDQLANQLITVAPSIDQSYSFDTTTPTCAAITILNASPTTGIPANALQYQVLFSEPVSSVSATNFSVSGLTINPSVSSVQPVSTPPCTAYVVTLSSLARTGASGALTLSLVPAVNTITNQAGTSLVSATIASNQSYAIDQVIPAVTSIAVDSANPTTGTGSNAPVFQVTFSKPVTNVSVLDFTATLNSASMTISTVSPSSTSLSTVYTVTLAPLASSGQTGALTLTMAGAAAGITDAATNGLSGTYPVGQSFTIDQSAPTVTGITLLAASPTSGTTASSLVFQVTFSEAVTGVFAANFTSTASGGPTAPTVSSVSPGPASLSAVYVVTLTALPFTGTGGLIGLTVSPSGITGVAGNLMTSGASPTNPTYTIDQLKPSVTAIAIAAASPTTGEVANQLRFTVTFSAAVTNVSPADFTASLGATPETISSVSPGISSLSSVYTVTVQALPVAGLNGSLTIAMSGSAGGIMDALGNALSAVYPVSQSYLINQTLPTVQSITPISANPGIAQLQFHVQFSTAVSGISPAAFAPLLFNGLAGSATIASVSPSGITFSSLYTVTLSPLTTAVSTSGSLGLSLLSFAGVQDALGNLATTTGLGSSGAYTITPPQIVSISSIDPNPNPAPGPVRFLVTFSTPVNNVVFGNFPFQTSAIITAIGTPSVSAVNASTYIVQVGGITLANGVDSAVLPLAFTAGTIRDQLGNIALSTVPLSNNTAYVITTAQPVLTLLGAPVTFQEHAALATVQVFNCTQFLDTSSLNFVDVGQQGSIDATIFIPTVEIVAPGTVSSDGLDTLSIQTGSSDPFSVNGLGTSPGGNTSGNLLLSGVQVGSFTYSSTQHNLHIIVNALVPATAVPRLINDISFSNSGNNPSASGREVFLSLIDGNNKSSATYTQNITMSLYNDTLPSINGRAAITPAPAPRIVQPGQSQSGHIPTNDVDSFFVSSLYDATHVKLTPSGIATPLTVPTAKGSVTISLYGDWVYTANAGSSGADAFIMNVTDIGPAQGRFSGGDALLPSTDILQQFFIVPAIFQESSPSFTSNPPVEAELASSMDYHPTIDPGVASPTNTFFDLIDLDAQGFVAKGTFQIDANTGEVTCSVIPNAASGYIHFAVLMEVTDASGTTRGSFQPILLKVVNSSSGGG